MEFEHNLKLNNLFDKDNYLNGFNKVRSQKLPFGENTDGSLDIDEISLGEDQIVFASVNNVFNRLLENDIYNEFLLKNQEDNVDLFPGPAIVKDKEYILRRNDEDTKYVYINEDTKETEIVRKKPDTLEKSIKYIPLEDSRVNGKTRVNFVERMNGYYIAGTNNGVWFAVKYEGPWKKANEKSVQMRKTVGKGLDLLFNGKNVIGFSPNQGFANNDSVLSSYQYVMATSEGGVYGCDPNLQWKVIPQLVLPEGVEINKIYSDEDTGKLYVLTKKGMYEYYGKVGEKLRFAYGLDGYSANDFTKLDEDGNHEDSNKLISTHKGIKQSESAMCFKNMVAERQFDGLVTRIKDYANYLFVGTGTGLYLRNGSNWTKILSAEVNDLAICNNMLFVAATNGLHYCDINELTTFKRTLTNKNITHITEKGNLICFSAADSNLLYYYILISGEKQVGNLKSVEIGSANNRINSLYCKNSELYVVSKEGIFYLSEENISSFNFVKVDSIGDKEITLIKNLGSITYVCFKTANNTYRLCSLSILNSIFDVDSDGFETYIEFDEPIKDIVKSVSPTSDLFSLRYIITEKRVYSFQGEINFNVENPESQITEIISEEETDGIKSFCSVYANNIASGDRILYNVNKTGQESKIFSKTYSNGHFINSASYTLPSGFKASKVLFAPNEGRLFAIGYRTANNVEESKLFEFPIQFEFALEETDETVSDNYEQKIVPDTIHLASNGTDLAIQVNDLTPFAGKGTNVAKVQNFPIAKDVGYLYAGSDNKLRLHKKGENESEYSDIVIDETFPTVKNVNELRNGATDYVAYLLEEIDTPQKIRYIDSDSKTTKFRIEEIQNAATFSHFIPLDNEQAFVWNDNGNLSVLEIQTNILTEILNLSDEIIKTIKPLRTNGIRQFEIATTKNIYLYEHSLLEKIVPNLPSQLSIDTTDSANIDAFEFLSTLNALDSSLDITSIEDALQYEKNRSYIAFDGIDITSFSPIIETEESEISDYALTSFTGNEIDEVNPASTHYLISSDIDLMDVAVDLSTKLSCNNLKIEKLNFDTSNNRWLEVTSSQLSTWLKGTLSVENLSFEDEINLYLNGLSVDETIDNFVIDTNFKSNTITDLSVLSATNNPLIFNVSYDVEKYSTTTNVISSFTVQQEDKNSKNSENEEGNEEGGNESGNEESGDEEDEEDEGDEESEEDLNVRYKIYVSCDKELNAQKTAAYSFETSSVVNLNDLQNVNKLTSTFTLYSKILHNFRSQYSPLLDEPIENSNYVYSLDFNGNNITIDGKEYNGYVELKTNSQYNFATNVRKYFDGLIRYSKSENQLIIGRVSKNQFRVVQKDISKQNNKEYVELPGKAIYYDIDDVPIFLIIGNTLNGKVFLEYNNESLILQKFKENGTTDVDCIWNKIYKLETTPILCKEYVSGDTSTIASISSDIFGKYQLSRKPIKENRPYQIDSIFEVNGSFYVYDSTTKKLFKASFTNDFKLRMQTSEQLSDVEEIFYTRKNLSNQMEPEDPEDEDENEDEDEGESEDQKTKDVILQLAFQKKSNSENKTYYIDDEKTHPTLALEIANIFDTVSENANDIEILAIPYIEKDDSSSLTYFLANNLFFKEEDTSSISLGQLIRFSTIDFKTSNFHDFASFSSNIKKFRSFELYNKEVLIVCSGNKLLFKIVDLSTLSHETITQGQWREISIKDLNNAIINEEIIDATFYDGVLHILTENRIVKTNIKLFEIFDAQSNILIDLSISEVLNAEHSKNNCKQLFEENEKLYVGYENEGLKFLLVDVSTIISNRSTQTQVTISDTEKTTDILVDNENNFYAISKTTNLGDFNLYKLEGYSFILANGENSKVTETIDSFCIFNETLYYIGNGHLKYLGSNTNIDVPPGETPKTVGFSIPYLYLGTNNGLYKGENSTVDLHVETSKTVTIPSAVNYSAAVKYFDNSLTFSYSTENIDDGTKDMYPTISRIHSSIGHLSDYDNENRTVYPATILESIDGYLFMSSGSYTRIFTSQRERNLDSYVTDVYQQALGKLVDGTFFITTVSKIGDGYYLGYGPHLISFNGFEEIDFYRPAYGDLRYLKMHYNRRVNRLLKIDNQNFLVGLQNGVRYFKDGQMNLNFVDRKHPERTISSPVTVIEEISKSDAEPEYMVVSKGKFYSNDTLVGKAFTQILDLENVKNIPEIKGESVTCIRVFGKNNYLIGTTNGLLCSRLTYTLFDEMHIITFKEIKDKIKAAWTKAFDKHMKTEHAEDQLVPRLQRKEDSDLSNFPNSFVNEIEYLRTSKSIQGYTSDIIDTIEYDDENHYIRGGITNWVIEKMAAEAPYSFDGFYSKMEDPNDSTLIDMMDIPYISMKWLSGMRDIYIYVPTTMTYYKNSPFEFSHSESASSMFTRLNFVGAGNQRNFIHTSCTKLRIYLDNAHFRIKQIHSIEVNGNSLPLKIYRENEAAENEVKRGREMNGHQLYDSVVLPTVCRTLPRTTSNATDNVNSITDNFNRICLDFSVYGTDSQSIHIITE